MWAKPLLFATHDLFITAKPLNSNLFFSQSTSFAALINKALSCSKQLQLIRACAKHHNETLCETNCHPEVNLETLIQHVGFNLPHRKIFYMQTLSFDDQRIKNKCFGDFCLVFMCSEWFSSGVITYCNIPLDYQGLWHRFLFVILRAHVHIVFFPECLVLKKNYS